MALSPKFSQVAARLYTVPQDPSSQGPEFPPLQTVSLMGNPSLSSKRFCPGDHWAPKRKPYSFGDSYQREWERRVSNSARLSPPVFPTMPL